MATNLLDTIRGNLTASTQPALTPPAESSTETAQKLLLTKTGRAAPVAGSEPAISNIGEKVAQKQTSGQLAQLGQQAQLASSAIAGQQAQLSQEEEQARKAIAQTRRQNDIQLRMETNKLLGDVERSGKKLDMEKDRATAEQIAFGIRQQNKKYIDALEMEGARKRLDDSTKFSEELSRSVFGDSTDLLKQKLGDKSIYNASERDFQRAMTNMSMLDWAAMARQQAREGARRAQWQSIAGLGQSVIGAYSKMGEKK